MSRIPRATVVSLPRRSLSWLRFRVGDHVHSFEIERERERERDGKMESGSEGRRERERDGEMEREGERERARERERERDGDIKRCFFTSRNEGRSLPPSSCSWRRFRD